MAMPGSEPLWREEGIALRFRKRAPLISQYIYGVWGN